MQCSFTLFHKQIVSIVKKVDEKKIIVGEITRLVR